jgi:hypothetical protein
MNQQIKDIDMKQVRESNAAKSLTVYVIMKGNWKVATVHVLHGSTGKVSLDIWEAEKAREKSHKASNGKCPDYGPQQATAGGYGYDKETAALAGLYIDGHLLTDHCSRLGAPKRTSYPRDYLKRGYHTANWCKELNGYSDLYRDSGLKYLEAFGYNVIRAI